MDPCIDNPLLPKATTSHPKWRSPTLVFIVIAFGIPWLAWTTLAIAGLRWSSPLGAVLFFTGDACSVAGFVAAYLAAGRAGVVDLLRRAVRFRAPFHWWVYALGLPLLWQVGAHALYGAIWGGIGHVKLISFAGFLTAPVLVLFLLGPLGEEFGWRGFLLPGLLRRYSPLSASLIMGVVWAVWHTPFYYARWVQTPYIALAFLIGVTGFSILFTGLYLGSRGNLLLCILMHWMINASQPIASNMFPDLQSYNRSYLLTDLGVLLAIAGVVAAFSLLSKRKVQELRTVGEQAG